MGEMTIALVIAVIVVIAIALVAMRWRSASGEQQALRHYQHALDTLRTVSDRMESSRPVVETRSRARLDDSEGPLEPDDSTGRRAIPAAPPNRTLARSQNAGHEQSRVSARPGGRPAATPAPRRDNGNGTRVDPSDAPATTGRGQSSESDRESNRTPNGQDVHPVLVFEEQAPVFEPEAAGPGSFRGPIVTRASRRALQRSSRPQSRLPMTVGVVLVVVVVAVVAALTAGLGEHHNSPKAAVHHPGVPAHQTSKSSTTTSSSTSTTAVQDVVPEASTATSAGATYAAPAGEYTVTLTSSGSCWVYAKLASTGALLWTGTLDQGQAQTLSGTGEIDVELGHANTMTETLNGIPVQYPAQFQAVFTMKFVPSTL